MELDCYYWQGASNKLLATGNRCLLTRPETAGYDHLYDSSERNQHVGEESESDGHLYTRRCNSNHQPIGSTSPTVKRAQRVAQQLGELNQQVKQTLHSGKLKENGKKRTDLQEISPDRHYKEVSKKLRLEAERDMNRRKQAWLEPAPLDDYLRRNQEVHMTGPALLPPPRSHVMMSPSQHNAPILTPMCAEAQALLKKVQTSKGILEANLDMVARTQDDEHFYQVIQNICREGDGSDFARMKQAVDEQIAAIDAEIKRELHQGRLNINKPTGRHSPPTRLLPDKIVQRPHLQQPTSKGHQPPTSKPVGQPSAGPVLGKVGKKKVQAKIDTGLRRPRKGEEPEVEVKGRGSDVTERNKENLRERTTVIKSPTRPTSKPTGRTQDDDDRYLKHIYGHTRLQCQRSTLKDAPYLHFANQTPTKVKKMAAHLASPVRAPSQRPASMQMDTHKSRGVGTHVPVTSTPQYYFNPYQAGSGPAPLVTPAPHPSSPADGQLIPMAIPLREPRSGMGMAQPVTIISGRGGAPARPVEGSNVVLIDIKDEEEEKKEPEKRDLTIQRLPNVDIDSLPATPASPQERISPETQPRNQVNNQISETEEEVEPSSPPIPGISMEGMQAARQPSYHGPPFPPQQLPPSHHLPATGGGGIQPSSDQLAAGIMRMEMLQTRAVDWVEQELMSRLISGTHLRQSERLHQPSTSHGARPVSPSSSENSDHVVGALGGGGLQLFVDAGQPVDPTLVNSLVQQVLEEKIALCLGQHERERLSLAMPTAHDVRQPIPQPVGHHSPVPTPKPTPPASPIGAPSREPSPTPRDRIPTPDASEMGEAASGGAESETESWKDLMKESLREEANTIAAPGPEAITTPPTTPPPISTQSPPPIPHEEPQTPVPSPPSSPTSLVGVPSEPMVTPTPTPEPRSPVASEPEEDAFQETLRTPSPEPRLPSPLPPPPKAATPAPPSVVSSSTTESTPPDSTITHSTGREISEGEWLVSANEEGRVPDETLFGVPEMEAFDESSPSSTTSTIKAPTDPDKDQEEPRSEGEVDPNRLKLTRDPVVALLSRIRQAPTNVPHPHHIPPPAGMQPTAASSPHSISSASSSSVGEVSEGQRPSLMPPAERLLYKEAYHSKPPRAGSDHRRSLGEVRSDGEEEHDAVLPPAGIKKGVDDAPSDENIPTPSPRESAAKPQVVPSPVARVIQVGREQPPKQTEEEEEEEGQEDLAEADMTAGGTLIDRPLASLYSTMASDLGTRTMTPDAMNMDAYLQSGYLSQTFSQSEGGIGGATSDLEGSRFLGQTNNSGFNVSGAGPRGSSLLGTSGMFSEDSLEVGVAVRGREERMTQRSFQVTLPSIAGLDEKEEESASEGEVHGGETISDVSEITL